MALPHIKEGPVRSREMILLFCILSVIRPTSAACGVLHAQSTVVHLTSSIANVEFENQEFPPIRPPMIRSIPLNSAGVLRFGRIARRFPEDPVRTSRHDVPIAASYVDGMPTAFWCDLNLDGELSDEKPMKLYQYPGLVGARAALVDLGWKAKLGADSIPIAWKLRVVLDPIVPPDSLPKFRLQRVFANTGKLVMDGQSRSVFLYDGNNDGIYSKDFGDGMFIDADGDGEVTVDTSSPEFLPFGVPTQVGGTLFETVRVDPQGAEVELSGISGQREQHRPSVGDPAPDFTFESLDGKRVRLSDYRGRPTIVYFWAAWCGSCVQLAPAIRAVYDRLHPRGLQMLGISFDRDRETLLAFEVTHREPWPISYYGREFWENPVGRLYGVSNAGSAYLIDGEGKFQGLYYDFEDLEEKAATLLPQ